MWDVDDVLNDLMKQWLRTAWKPLHPECSLDYGEITANPPHELLGVNKQEYLDSLDTFRREKFQDLKPIPEMVAWFQRYGTLAEHLVVTSTPLFLADRAAEWVFKHFGEWVRSFNVVPSPRGEKHPRTRPNKAEYLQVFSRVDIVVEDNPETIRQMSTIGLAIVTIPRPWNKSKDTLKDAIEKITRLIVS